MTQPGSSVDAARSPHHAATRGPFQPHGDPHLFYAGGGRGETLDALLEAIRAGQTVLHVEGERGSGRTLLSLVLAARLSERRRVLRREASLTEATFLRTLLLELAPRHADLVPMDSEGRALDVEALDVARRSLVAALEERSADARPIVLVVDGGDDGCDAATLALVESIAATRAGRATAGFGATPDATSPAGPSGPPTASGPGSERRRRRPAVQLVLFLRVETRVAGAAAAPEATPAAAHPTSSRFALRRLNLAEVGEYLHHHMLLFDYNRRNLFTREMAYFVADRSEGVFRAIDTIARNAFTIAGVQNADRPTLSHLLLAGLPPRPEPESPGTSFLSRHRGAVVAAFGSSVVALTFAAVVLATR